MATIGDRVRSMTEFAELLVPWDRGDVLASVHREGQVLSESAEEHGMRLKVRLEPSSLGALKEYVVQEAGVEDA
jgi:GTP-binding protein HflX